MLILLLLAAQAVTSAYVPGTPGAPWTEDELATIKSRIRWIIKNPVDGLKLAEGGAQAMADQESKEGIPFGLRKDAVLPNLAKIVRLTFHDCINEVSGAGCNGCLNFHGVGNIYSHDKCSKPWNKVNCETIDNGTHPAKGPFATDNNNLLWVAKVLEVVYREDNFGGKSLYDLGKSRADLWAYSGLVSIEYATEKQNKLCNINGGEAPCLMQIDDKSERCDFNLPEVSFKTGRSDCVPSCTGDNDYPFCTSAEEIHPNPNGNGEETVKFFKDNFNFSPRAAAALMGVHTLGHPSESNSMFRHYPWTQQGKEDFNNFYYINIVNSTAYRYANPTKLLRSKGIKPTTCGLKVSAFIGDEYGNPMPAGYKVRSELRTKSYGPWNWNLFGKQCSKTICNQLAAAGEEYAMNSCCHHVDLCATEVDKCQFSGTNYLCKSSDGTQCTELKQFLRTNMLSPDMGLYVKFDTDENGRPHGCPGLDSENWVRNKDRFSGITSCPLNDAPGDDKLNMAEVMELYAKDNKVWVEDFMEVFIKMLENGVDQASLVESPKLW